MKSGFPDQGHSSRCHLIREVSPQRRRPFGWPSALGVQERGAGAGGGHTGQGRKSAPEQPLWPGTPQPAGAPLVVRQLVGCHKRLVAIGLLRLGIHILVIFLFEYPATVLARLTWASKLAQGAEAEAIVRKELALSGIQRPLYPGELGEDAVEVFRFGDFVGWIIEG